MKNFKKIGLIVTIITSLMMLFSALNIVKATDLGGNSIYLTIKYPRTSGQYMKGTAEGNTEIIKIKKSDASNVADSTSTDQYYCIKGGTGFGDITKPTSYTQSFNLKDLSSITGNYLDVLPKGENLNKLMWVLDNIYAEIGKHGAADSTESKASLATFFTEKQTEGLTAQDYTTLSEDDVDVIQQGAIWYFTNNTTTDPYHFDVGTFSTSLQVNGVDFALLNKPKADAADAYYDWLITTAEKNNTYTSVNFGAGDVKVTNPTTTVMNETTDGTAYLAGPYQVTVAASKASHINSISVANYTDTNNAVVDTKYASITDATGKAIAAITPNTEFYVKVLKTANVKGITANLDIKYANRALTYYSVDESAAKTNQPIVKIENTSSTVALKATGTIVKFDLALRKFITEVNGVAVKTSREPVVDVTKLASGASTTATYNHTKQPIKVAIGDIVTYTIRVYNEGEEDGYVSEITDHLPNQLEFIADDKVNIDNGWQLTSPTDLKTIKTAYLSKDNEAVAGGNKILAFDKTKMTTEEAGKMTHGLYYKDVKIKCKVISTAEMPKKITNIADITAFTDGDGNKVTDRDSEPKNVTLPTGTELENYNDAAIARAEQYIPGQQDDDDFEKLQLKEFDLSLRKFITKVNSTDITTRIPKPDTTKLASGVATTATYNHTKNPVRVALGDVVIYTIRVYNEGEVDGYVNEITNHLPDQLEYIADNEVNKNYEWTQDATNNKIIKTSYLSKNKEAADRQNKIIAFDGTTLSYKDVQIACKVISTTPMVKKITNIAEITGFVDANGSTVTDRDSDTKGVNMPADLPGYKDNEINNPYVPGQQDDDDFEKLQLKEFDLSLRKFVTKVNAKDITTRIPKPDTTNLAAGTETTAIYNHTKEPMEVSLGDTVIYTIRVYNEGEVDGYVNEITDHLPDQLEYIADNEVNKKYEWVQDTTNTKIIKTSYLSKNKEAADRQNKIIAFDGTTLSYKDVQIACKVISTTPMVKKITNIAEITGFVDVNGNTVTDRDSDTKGVNMPADLPGYKDNEINNPYVPGQQDDDDFEKLQLKEFDLSLRKFITKVNTTDITSRIPVVDTTKLKDGTSTTAVYNHSKQPVKVTIGDVVIYTIRVYNEDEQDGYANEITDHLPDQLEYIADNEVNKKYEWVQDTTNTKIIKTSYLSKDEETLSRKNLLTAYNGGSTLSYKDVQIACKVISTTPMVNKITNIAEITDTVNKNGDKVKDRDSTDNNVDIPKDLPGYKDDEINKPYVPGQQDDDDFEKLQIKDFDLSLRKFITKVNETDVTTRIPVVDATKLKDGTSTTATYNHTKEPVLVVNGNIVTYTIRVYNEGETSGYASQIKDDIPQGLQFLPDDSTNKEYRWVMLDADGKETTDSTKAVTIATDYLSKEQGEARMKADSTLKQNPALLNAYDATKETSDTNPDYADVKIAFKVTEPSTSDRIIINQAQISKNTNEHGEDVTDRDSTPDKWVDGEDDQDIEKIKVQYFDLALRKWVTQAITIENDKSTVTETGHKAEDDPEGVVKVELKKKNINNVTVKFRYSIRVTNQGTIAGYVKEIKDYIPDGLKFVAEDNTQWTALDDKTIVTDQAKDVLLKPGESTEVQVLLTWINSSDNMGLKVNVAEISKDYNEFNAPDIDSTPNNKKDGEDDIDDAPVLLSIKTGQVQVYILITGAVLIILASGVILIKKFVM